MSEIVKADFQEEIQPYKNGKAFSIIKAPISEKQLLAILQETPRNHIYTRPGKGGGKWEFVTGVYVKKMLNYVFGWLWDFQVIDKGREDNQVWIHGRLTIKDENQNPIIIKEQFGRADVKIKKGTNTALDYGNDLKAATTDALKKCASELGIASDVYGKNEFKRIPYETKNAIETDYELQEQSTNRKHLETDIFKETEVKQSTKEENNIKKIIDELPDKNPSNVGKALEIPKEPEPLPEPEKGKISSAKGLRELYLKTVNDNFSVKIPSKTSGCYERSVTALTAIFDKNNDIKAFIMFFTGEHVLKNCNEAQHTALQRLCEEDLKLYIS